MMIAPVRLSSRRDNKVFLNHSVGRIALGLGMGVVGLQGIVDNNQVAAAAGERAADRGRSRNPLAVSSISVSEFFLPDPRALEQP